MTGLTAADVLVKAGRDVVIFDKGRGSGGRISTRRAATGVFDHGAPEIHSECPVFSTFLRSLGGVAKDGSYYGAPGMRSILQPLIDGKNIKQGMEVTEVARENRGWVLRFANGRSMAHFHSVLVSAPAPQAADLIEDVAPYLASDVRRVCMQAIWSCLVEFSEKLNLPGKLGGKGRVFRADRMSEKPNRVDAREAWVIHMAPEFVPDFPFAEPAIVAPAILDAFSEAYDVRIPRTTYLDAHRWRYAFAKQALGRPFVGDPEAGLLVGGDWTLGRRAEHGFESGREMAQALLSRKVVNV